MWRKLTKLITSLYMRRESTSYVYTIPVPRTGNRGLVGPAPALCWGRATGVMCNIWQLYFLQTKKMKYNFSGIICHIHGYWKLFAEINDSTPLLWLIKKYSFKNLIRHDFFKIVIAVVLFLYLIKRASYIKGKHKK